MYVVFEAGVANSFRKLCTPNAVLTIFFYSLVNGKKLCELTYVCTCACTHMHACTHTHSVSLFVSLSPIVQTPK